MIIEPIYHVFLAPIMTAFDPPAKRKINSTRISFSTSDVTTRWNERTKQRSKVGWKMFYSYPAGQPDAYSRWQADKQDKCIIYQIIQKILL